MGQAHSDPERAACSHEHLTRELASKFADKCFTSLELYSLKNVFRSLADHESEVHYLKENTVARFLEVPDTLDASPVIFQMMSFIAAFPFLRDAPAVLGLEQIIIVVTLMTQRFQRVLARGSEDRHRLIFSSLAVHDRKLSLIDRSRELGETRELGEKTTGAGEEPRNEQEGGSQVKAHAPGFAVDEAGYTQPHDSDLGGVEEEDDDDDMVLAALEALGTVDVFKHGNTPPTHGAMIPVDNLRKLILLLLLIAPLDAQERLSSYAGRITGNGLDALQTSAESVLAAFLSVEKSPGIKFKAFNTVVSAATPFLFNGLAPLFEHFLFSQELHLGKHKDGMSNKPALLIKPAQPLLAQTTPIMNVNLLCQLSFFLPGTLLFRRLRLLYSGDDDGFSMGSFETKCFNWRAPTILLVQGTCLPNEDEDRHHRAAVAESSFLQSLPPRRFPSSATCTGEERKRVTFGAFVKEPWRHSSRECFGGNDTLLFQLEPVHDVFRTSALNKNYISFMRPSPSNSHAGIFLGCPPPPPTHTYRTAGGVIALGSVSLVLDSSFEFGCFTHDYTSRGGAFQNSASRRSDFQDRFEVTSLEVWGCGGDDEAKNQADRWAWEAREAEARRRINLGTGDIQADRALLEMAGLIGANRSGGSVA